MPLFLLGLVLSLPLCLVRTIVIPYAFLHMLVRPFVLYLPTRHTCSLPLLSIPTLLISLLFYLDKGILGLLTSWPL